MTILQQLRTSEPVAFGGFSELHVFDGVAVKILEDACYQDVLEECYRQNIAAEAGLAPKIYQVMKLDGEVIVTMDAIDTDKWYHADGNDDVAPTLLGELNDYEAERGLLLFCQLLKAGLIHADFHTGNWFLNDNDEVMAIDFGIASELHEAADKHIMRAIQFMIPALQNLGFKALAADLHEAWIAGPEVARYELSRVANIIA